MTSRASELTHHVLPEPVDGALAGERNERDLARLPRFKAHRGAGGDIEPHAARFLAVEFQRRIGLEEMIMRADLDRPIAGIGDRQAQRLAAGIELDLAVLDEHLTGDHGVPSSYRLMHRYQLRSIGERRLHLDVVDHFGNAVHHLAAREHVRARLHQFGHGLAVARTFDDEIGDERHRLGMIELDATLAPPARHHRSHGDQQLVFFARGQVHDFPSGVRSPQLSHSRGNDAPRTAASTATRSWRSASPSAAQNRTTASPFQAETPTSPRKRSPSARTTAAVPSSPGTTSTVATAMPPLATAGRASLAATAPSSRKASAWMSRPPRRRRQRSRRKLSCTVSPMPERPNTIASANTSRASSARSTSIVRLSRARSNRIVSCGSQASEPPAATSSFTSIVASGASVR